MTALEAIAEAHRRYGRVQEVIVQEVIVQNFRPKAGTAMRHLPPCPPQEHLRAIALARLLLPPEVHVQAPPNLTDDLARVLAAGIDDWGGVSPIIVDHVKSRTAVAGSGGAAYRHRGRGPHSGTTPDHLPGVHAGAAAVAG